jgi:pimeloyl-ACP methyl ester carboxylesterase
MTRRWLLPVAAVCAALVWTGCGSTDDAASPEPSVALDEPSDTTLPDASTTSVDSRAPEPTGESAPSERDVSFDSLSGEFSLAGTLTVPAGEGPFPGVVLVSGSLSQDRNETIGTKQPFLVLADGLARHGIAVLRFDDRGAGQSEGEPVELSDATTLDLADDAQAAAEFLAMQPEIDEERVGLLGHSEGALHASIVANRSDVVSYVVLAAGSGVPGAEVIVTQTAAGLRSEGASQETVDWAVEARKALIDAALSQLDQPDYESEVRAITEAAFAAPPPGVVPTDPSELSDQIEQNVFVFALPWMRYFIGYDPAPALRDLSVPVLAVQGSLDVQAVADVNIPATEQALADNPDATVVVLDGLNHIYQEANTGAVSEYESLDDPFADEAIELIADWISANT